MENFEGFLNLIEEQESEYLDFKNEYTVNTADLVHDILCLSNARTNKDRFIFIGIEDKTKILNDIINDANRKTQAQLIDTLRNAHINHLPDIRLFSGRVPSGETIDILKITNNPLKPYFLNRDYRVGKTTVRAGVIYSRDGDTNTPLDRSATMTDLEWMFRQRFGIDIPPLQRAKSLLYDKTSWLYDYAHGSMYFYHQLFPELTIQEVLTEDGERRDKFDEPWVRVFPDRKASRGEYYLKYHSTKLASLLVVWCDGARWAQVQPEIFLLNPGFSNIRSYYMVGDSLQNLVQEMINAIYPQHSQHYLNDIIAVFASKIEAETELKKDWEDGVKKFSFFDYDQTENKEYLIRSDKKRLLL